MKTPLVVVLIKLGNIEDTQPYADTLREAFSATGQSRDAGREILQAAEFREFFLSTPKPDGDLDTLALDFIDSAERLLVFVLDARSAPAAAGNKLSGFEQKLLSLLDQFPEPAKVVAEFFLKYPGSLFESAPEDSRLVRFGLKDLDERDLRLPFLSLHALHQALCLFGSSPIQSRSTKHARFFFSHAKRDGVPITSATRDWMMERLAGFQKFYDTDDLNLDGDIDAQLDNAVNKAVVIVFRTDIFDQRYWCQREVLWAEKHGRPVITVDARWQIEYRPSVVSFDGTPVVRIPDGNVVRIFATALAEALRIELFKARAAIHARSLGALQIEAIPRFPSLISLTEACKSLRASGQPADQTCIVYPNPSLPAVLLEASQDLTEWTIGNRNVLSLDEFRLID